MCEGGDGVKVYDGENVFEDIGYFGVGLVIIM